jgi:phosphoribosyl 1,2-cyclic phosphodiesterase
MMVRCWGARGSLPVSGPEYLTYGGNTTCIEVRSKDGDVIIIDAGTGIRKLGNKLLADGLASYRMIFTHAHWDHLMGFPFFLPIYHARTRIEISGWGCATHSIRDILSQTMARPYFPVDFSTVRASIEFIETCSDPFSIGKVEVRCIPLNHPGGGIAYRLTEDGKSFVFLTDNELSHHHEGGRSIEEYIEFSRGADLLIHDAEYRPGEYVHTRGWGHSVYTEALDLALKANVKNFWLFHHNVERTDEDLGRMVEDCVMRTAEAGSSMICKAATETSSIEI